MPICVPGTGSFSLCWKVLEGAMLKLFLSSPSPVGSGAVVQTAKRVIVKCRVRNLEEELLCFATLETAIR